MQTIALVKAALLDKAPALHKQLQESGKLTEYVQDLADQISSEIVSMTQAQRMQGKWDNLGPLECARRMKSAENLNQEKVLAEMLEFPQDETSQQNQDETTSLDLTT
jgi:hypothetical protein